MPEDVDPGRRRVASACLRCRKHKIKCSGSQPCKRCDYRGLDCVFNPDDRKVVVSERLLQNLRSKVNELEQQRQASTATALRDIDTCPIPSVNELADFDTTGLDPTHVPRQNEMTASRQLSLPDAEAADEGQSMDESATPDHTSVSNPLVGDHPAYLSISGRLRYLGHSSTWSFTQQVLEMTYKSPRAKRPPRDVMYVEGEAYKLPYEKLFAFEQSDVSGLPSLDLSLYYVQSVKFRTHPLFFLFDEQEFTASLRQFYKAPMRQAQAKPLWFIHYLVIMALGKALVTDARTAGAQDAITPGSRLLTRALRLLPDVSYLCSEPIKATEILCSIALYLQSTDHRCAAHIYIGQGLRMAQGHGLHKDLQADVGGDELVRRYRRLWWTVYTLDRRFSSSFGVPTSLQDEDITTPLPKPSDDDDEESGTARMLYVQICQLYGRVISTVYSSQNELNKTFVLKTRTILKGVAGLSAKLKAFSQSCFGEISRVAAHVNLAYHQCILVSSRPVLYYAFKQRLEGASTSKKQAISSTIKGLIQVCIDSATQIVSVLSQLMQHHLLDIFLPFDLESAASAGFVLAMASNIHPKLSFAQDWFGPLIEVLDFIATHGNVLAKQRKSEIEDLVSMLSKDQTQPEEATNAVPMSALNSPAPTPSFDPPSFPSLGDPFFADWNLDDPLSGGQIMELATALDVGSLESFDMGGGEDFCFVTHS